MKELRVVQLSKSDRAGGASIAAFRLHCALRNSGVPSYMLVNNKTTDNDYVVGPGKSIDRFLAAVAPFAEKIPLRLFGLKRESGKLSLNWVPDRIGNRLVALKPDVLNLHWVNDGFLRIESVPKLHYPTVWTLHDMWAFCGAEHYVGSDTRFKTGYLKKDRPLNDPGWDANRWVWERKCRAWKNLRQFVVVTPSEWLATCVRESQTMGHLPVHVIPNGIDERVYKPMPHDFARDVLSLPKDRKLILFGAGGASDDPRKGYSRLVEAINKLVKKCLGTGIKVDLVVFGPRSRSSIFDTGCSVHYLGKLRDEIALALAYASADVFVAPSIEDNLPNTVLESLACGTPVVAFKIGGMPDMIEHKKCGYLAHPYDTDDLAEGISWVLDSGSGWKTISGMARQRVCENFTMELQARRYRKIYHDLVVLH